jgi:hypothetical protein
MRLRQLLLATAALSALPNSVQADDFYTTLFGGLSIPETTRMHYWGSSAYDISRDDGFVLGGALGTHLWNDNWRGELELAYARSDVSEVLERDENQPHAAFGDLAHLTLLANLWRDFILPQTHLQPYLGGGLGVALTLPDWCFDENDGGACQSNGAGVFDTSELALAAQGGAGTACAPFSERIWPPTRGMHLPPAAR